MASRAPRRFWAATCRDRSGLRNDVADPVARFRRLPAADGRAEDTGWPGVRCATSPGTPMPCRVQFVDRVSLEAHRKAASYTIAKTRLALVETAASAAVLVGAHAARRPAMDRRHPARLGRPRVCVPAAVRHCRRGPAGRHRPAVLLDTPVPHRSALRLQPHDTGAVACRSRQVASCSRQLLGAAAARGRDRADAQCRRLVVGLCVAAVGRVQRAGAGDLSDHDRADLQPIRAPEGLDPGAADRCTACTHRILEQGRIRDGRLAPLGAWQCLLHGPRPREAHRLLRHPGRSPAAGRDRGGAGARTRALQAQAHRQAHGVLVRGEPAVSRAARLAGRSPVVLYGPWRLAGPRRRQRRRRTGAVHAGAAGVHVSSSRRWRATCRAGTSSRRTPLPHDTPRRAISSMRSSSSTRTTPPR